MKKEITGLTPDLITKLRSCYIAERKALSAKLPINEVLGFLDFIIEAIALHIIQSLPEYEAAQWAF